MVKKAELPMFDREDPTGWIVCVEVYFQVQEMHAAMYGVIMESSKPNTQKRTNLGLHVVQHTKVSQKSK